MEKLAIIGTNGIPPKYGGFETLVENLVNYLSDKYEITVFCSSKSYPDKITHYKNCELKYIDLKANGWQGIFYDTVSLLKTYRNYDIILMLGMSGFFILPFLKKYKNKFYYNFGGIDWERSKWNSITQNFIKKTVNIAIRYTEHIIADNIGIQEYISKEYKRDSTLISYGGDQAFVVSPLPSDIEKYPFLNSDYAFTVARIQPDNNIDMILDSFLHDSRYPLVFVGNWNRTPYGIYTKSKYTNIPNIILIDAIYDQHELNLLRSNCKVYLHGHSAGGTNPALVEAMNLALPIFTFDCSFNKYTTEFKAEYFSSSIELTMKLNTVSDQKLKEMSLEMFRIANESYQWKIIAQKYYELFNK